MVRGRTSGLTERFLSDSIDVGAHPRTATPVPHGVRRRSSSTASHFSIRCLFSGTGEIVISRGGCDGYGRLWQTKDTERKGPRTSVRTPQALGFDSRLPNPHVHVIAGAPEDLGVHQRIQQGVAHPRVQGPQILDLRFRQMQARDLGVLGRINCSQSGIVISPVSPMACPFMRSDASLPGDRGVWVSSASSTLGRLH